jgi:hypothetical protein
MQAFSGRFKWEGAVEGKKLLFAEGKKRNIFP